MKRIPVLPLVAFSLFSCAKSKDVDMTKLPPVSKAESQAIKASVQTGHGLAPGQQPAVAATNCADFVKKLPGFVAGSLDVPEDWDHPDASQHLKVFYYWRKAEGDAEKRPPVVFFNGGPASDSHSSSQLLAPLPFTANASLVFFDQRGTGCSTPFPTEISEANADRLMKWGSRGIIGDSEALRKHLFGDRKWRLYGQSYGGFLVHRYLELAPDGADRAIARGFSVMQDPVAWTAERIRSQFRVSGTFFEKFPDDKTILQMARASIPEKQCWQSGADSICGPAVLDSLTIMLGFQDDWPALHQWLQELRGADGKVNATTLNSLVRTFVFGVYGDSGLAGDVISKMEIVPGYDDRTGCNGALQRLRDAGEHPDDWLINECRLLATYQKPNFDVMKNVTARPIQLDAIGASLTRGPEQLFLFSGQQDVFVPFATFDEEVKHLGKLVHYESFPNSGHEGFYSEPHVQEAVTGQ